jgi:Chaperone of endosialidase
LSPDAPGVDPAMGQAARDNAALGREQLAWNKQIYEENKPRQEMIDEYGRKISDAQLASMEQQSALAKDYEDYMKGTFRPVEGSLVEESMKDPTAEAERLASEAGAGVDQQFNAARANKQRELASMGINPNSGRWDSSTQGSMDAQAATKADSMNKTRTAGMAASWAKRMDTASLGRNLPSNQATSAGLALTAGNSAMNTVGAPSANYRADAAGMNQGYTGAINANSSAANIYGQKYSADMQGYQADQTANAGLWSGIGTFAGMAYAKGSSKKIKFDKQPIDDAEILNEIKTLPVEKWKYKKGEGDEGEHIGPYAEDVQKKFGDRVAPGGKMVDIISMMGVNMAATKALAKQVDKIERSIGRAK